MAVSRYITTAIVDSRRYSTWRNRFLEVFGNDDMLVGIDYSEYTAVAGERLDHLAYRFYGDEGYYWVIALVNSISDPLGSLESIKLRIPVNVKDIIDRLS